MGGNDVKCALWHLRAMSNEEPSRLSPLGDPPPTPKAPPANPRWRLIVDVVVFQGKLGLDALRDLLLSPISIVLALAGLLTRRHDPGAYFYDLMRLGRRSDHFIGLFNAGLRPDERDEFTSVDDIVETIEKVVVDEHARGGMTTEAKAHIDRTLDQLDETIAPERIKLTWRFKRAAVIARREARKVRDQLTSSRDQGPGR